MGVVIDASQFSIAIDQLRSTTPAMREEILKAASLRFIDAAVTNLNNNGSVITGNLKHSFDYKIANSTDKATSTITASAKSEKGVEYAYYVEYGRGPVVATNVGSLHFKGKDGSDVFVKSVGPASAKPFMAPALKTVSDEIPLIVSTILKKYAWS